MSVCASAEAVCDLGAERLIRCNRVYMSGIVPAAVIPVLSTEFPLEEETLVLKVICACVKLEKGGLVKGKCWLWSPRSQGGWTKA